MTFTTGPHVSLHIPNPVGWDCVGARIRSRPFFSWWIALHYASNRRQNFAFLTPSPHSKRWKLKQVMQWSGSRRKTLKLLCCSRERSFQCASFAPGLVGRISGAFLYSIGRHLRPCLKLSPTFTLPHYHHHFPSARQLYAGCDRRPRFPIMSSKMEMLRQGISWKQMKKRGGPQQLRWTHYWSLNSSPIRRNGNITHLFQSVKSGQEHANCICNWTSHLGCWG